MTLLAFSDLKKNYRLGDCEVPALAGITATIDRGELVAIMGASGSGKSTLMNIIGCLDQPTSGLYLLDGEDVASVSDRRLAAIRNRKIGFVFQSFNLLPRLTAIDNVQVPLLYGGVRKEERLRRARAALRSVGLDDRALHRPSELSGGQQQRVAIARAIVNDPPLVLADEPTGSLDSEASAEIVTMITDLNVRGTTIVLVTHDPEIASHAKRRIILKDGKIIADHSVGDPQ